MRRDVSVGCCLALVVLSSIYLQAEDIALDTPQIAFMSYKANQLLKQVQQACDSLHLRFVGPSYFVPTWGTVNKDYDGMLSIRGDQVRLDGGGYSFDFRIADARFTGFQDTKYDEVSENQVSYYPADQPKWSKDKAIAVAAEFEKIFVEPKETILGQPVARYEHNSGNVSKNGKTRWRLGMWYVSWPRVDSQGHPFYGDGITVEIQEGFGLTGIGVDLSTPFTEEKGAPISEEKALATAQWRVFWTRLPERSFYKRTLTDYYQWNVTSYKITSRRLVVVIPHAGHPTRARLAWEFWFHPIHASPVPAGGWYIEDFSVWVDAHSGSVIGGDCYL